MGRIPQQRKKLKLSHVNIVAESTRKTSSCVLHNCQLKNHFHRVCKQRKKSDLERSTNSVNRLDNSSDSDDSLYNIEHLVGAVNSTGTKWFATLDLNIERMPARSVTCQMDCGSTCNILSFMEYCKIAQDGNPDLQKSNAKL